MSQDVKRRSPAEWFLESFFQERNIKWMLALGVMIVFGSSLMLVTKQWDHWAPFWKALTVIGYSAAVFGAGELSYHRLGLRNTGTVMRTLTLLLLPVSFLAIHRLGLVEAQDASVGWLVRTEQLGLLVLDAVLTAYASRRIFSQFLRGPQPTLVASYVALAVAGGLLSPMSATASPFVALILWSVFAIGTVKSARQVFWLAEEHKLPRVCGFLPVVVLGIQFLTLFALNCAGQIALPWIGLGCVLTAVPVLFTTDAIAKVFLQRTGDLVRPLPWSIVLPLFVGLVLCFVGVGMSAIGFPFSMALTPAAGLAAVMMLMTARRTGHSAFVWMSLLSVAVAYQATPAFFQEVARSVVSSAASAVREQRLPVAFYGLTWLPLILAATFASVRAARRGDTLIAFPARRFAMGVASLLFAICFTHTKAIFPVSAVMVTLFGLQAVLFRKRGLLVGSAAAWIGVCLSSRIFLESVCGISISADAHQWLMTAGAAALLSVGSWIDRRSLVLSSFTNPKRQRGRTLHDALNSESTEALALADASGHTDATQSAQPILGAASVLMTIGLAAYWVAHVGSNTVPVGLLINGVALAALLMTQAWKWPSRGLGELAWGYVAAGIVAATHSWPIQINTTLLTWSIASLAIWCFGRISEANAARDERLDHLANALGRPAVRVSLMALLLITVVAQGSFLLTHLVGGCCGGGPHHWLPWLPALLLLAWPFDAAWRFRQRWLTVLGCVGLMSFVGIAMLESAEMLKLIPAAWGTLAAIGVLASGAALARRPSFDHSESDPDVTVGLTPPRAPVGLVLDDIFYRPIHAVAFGVLVLIAVASLLNFTMPIRLAGFIAVAALGIETAQRGQRELKWQMLAIGHWQIVAFVAKCFAPSIVSLNDLLSPAMSNAVLPVALTLAAGVGVMRLRSCDANESEHEILGLHCFAGLATTALALMFGLFMPGAALTIGQMGAAIATFAVLAMTEVALAVRRQRAAGIWMAQGLLGAGLVWLLLAGVIHFGNGIAMFACMGAAVAWTIAARASARFPQTRFAIEALEVPANLLPLAAAVIGVARHVTGTDSALGMNSLGLLLPAAFYFWQAIETADDAEHHSIRRDRFVVSAIILNVASALLCRELHWSDAQFFMIPAGLTILWLVELLKREIPATYHDPLRYAGALTILVSPTFHIVSGSWLHLISLMACSVMVALLAIGLRLRALMYSGTAFLIADLIAMVVRGSVDHPNLLWLAGLGIGAAVITLGAICENHREGLLARLRLMAAELQSWR